MFSFPCGRFSGILSPRKRLPVFLPPPDTALCEPGWEDGAHSDPKGNCDPWEERLN